MDEIRVKHGEVTRLMKQYGVSAPTVRKALRYETHTLLAQKIRSAAKARGGREMEIKQ
jgi:hypothetical protein